MNSKIIDRLIKKIDNYKKSELLLRFLVGFLILIISSLIFIFTFSILDNIFHLTKNLRIISFIILLIINSFIIIKNFQSLKQIFISNELEISLEKQNNHFENLIINAVMFLRENKFHNNILKSEIIKQASETILNFQIINPIFINKIKKLLFPFIITIILILTYNSIYPDYFKNGVKRILIPLFNIPPVTRVKVEHDFKDTKILSGDTLIIKFKTNDSNIKKAQLTKINNDTKKVTEEIILKNDDDNFYFSFENARKNFQWKIKVGDYSSNYFYVDVIKAPQIIKQNLKISPPEYIKEEEAFHDNIFRLISLLSESSVQISLEFDTKLEALFLYDQNKNVKIPFIKTNENSWFINIPIQKSISYSIIYKIEQFKESKINKSIYFSIKEDTPPEITIKTPLLISIAPYEDAFEIGTSIEDDYGINTVKLLLKNNDENNFSELDNIFVSGQKTFVRKWFLNYSSLLKKSKSNILELKITANDNYKKRNQEAYSKSIIINKMNANEYNALLLTELVQKKHLLKSIIINSTLNKKTLDFETLLKSIRDFIKDIDILLMKIKLNKMEDIRTSTLKKKISSFNNEYLASKTELNNSTFNQWHDSLLNIYFDIDSECDRLLPFIIQKSISHVIEQLNKIDAYSNKIATKINLKDLFDFEMHYQKLDQTLKYFQEFFLSSKLIHLKSLTNRFKIDSQIRQLESFISMNKSLEIKNSINNLIQNLEIILTEFFLTKKEIDKDSYIITLKEVEKLIKRLERTLQIMKRINLNKITDDNSTTLTFKFLTNTLGHFILKIEELQAKNHNLGIKGTTLLSAVLFDFKELAHFYKRKSYSKAESKLKKATSNLSLCIISLKKLLKNENTLKNDTDIKNIESQKPDNESSFTIVKPTFTDAFYDPEAVILIEGIVKAPNGCYEAYIDIFTNNNHDEEGIKLKESIKINEYFDLPLELNVKYELHLNRFNLEENDKILIKMRALEYEIDDIKTIESKPIELLIKKTNENHTIKDYFELKSTTYDILYTLINALKENYKIFETCEINILKENYEPLHQTFIEVINNQKLISKKYQDLINELTFFSKKTNSLPENKFYEILFFANNTIKDVFLKSISSMMQFLSLYSENIKETFYYMPLLTEIKTRLNFLKKSLEKLAIFFGPSLSITKTDTENGKQIFEINNITQNALIEIKTELKTSDYNGELIKNINSILKRYLEKVSFYKSENILDLIISYTNDFIDKNSDTSSNSQTYSHNIDLLFRKFFLLIKNEQKKEILKSFKTDINQKDDNNNTIFSKIVNSSDNKSINSSNSESDEIIKMFHKFTISNPEQELDSLKQFSLLKNKFDILNQKLQTLPEPQNFTERDIKLFQSLYSLFKIFELQLLHLKNNEKTIDFNILETIYSNLLSFFDKTNKMLLDSLTNFKLINTEKISNEIKKHLKINAIDRDFEKNISNLTLIVEKLKTSIEVITSQNINETTLQETDNAIKIIFEVINNYKSLAENIFIKYNNSYEKLLTDLFFYKFAIEENKTIFIEDVIKEIQKDLYVFEPMLLDIMNELINKKYLELNDKNIKEIENKILKNSSKINEMKQELNTLLQKREHSSNDQEHINRIQKDIFEIQEENNKLKDDKNKLSNISDIKMIVIKPDKPYILPNETKLSLKKVENELSKADSLLSKNETLDQAILRNLIEEIEEIETKNIDDSNNEKKLNKIKTEIELLEGKSYGNSKEEIKENLQKDFIIKEEKIKSDSLAKIIDALNDATKFNEQKQDILKDEENSSKDDLKIRYLDLIKNQEKNYEKIELNMKNVKLLSQQFEIKTNHMLKELKYNISELSQNIENNLPIEETLLSIENHVNNLNEEFSKEANIKLVNSPFKLYEKGLEENRPRFFQGKELKEYEDIINLYLKLIAE